MILKPVCVALAVAVIVVPAVSLAQERGGLDPASLLAPLAESWPTYSGDYSGRRNSGLTQVTTDYVSRLTLAWTRQLDTGTPALEGANAPTFVGGEGTGDFAIGSQRIKGSILQVDDLLYVTAPDHVWALDVRDGGERWHYFWKTRGGPHIGNRGAALWRDSLIFETVDNYLVSLDARTGEERWHTEIASFEEQYFSTMAPIVVGDHLLVGTGNDLDAPGFLQSFDPETGEMAWYFQTSPHDTHDWDSAQTPILIDGVIDGVPRKLVSTAARNGYFFTLDRVTGEHIVTTRYGATSNWASHIRESGSPNPNSAKEAIVPGALVSPVEGGVANWQPPAFNPDTGLFYTQENNGFNLLYLTELDPRGSMGLGGKDRITVGSGGNALSAIDYRTGETAWRHAWPIGGGGGAGVLTTAGGLVFTGDGSGNFVAFDAADGDLLWHTRIGNISNAPQTYLIDGRQHVLVASDRQLYAFVMY